MDFGRVDQSKLGEINFKLSKEPYSNSKVLKGRTGNLPKFYVGLAKWGKKEWIGHLYPGGTKESAFQTQYLHHFNTIEFNATHYKLPSEQDVGRWTGRIGDGDFVFCPKVYQGISHYGNLKEKQFLTDVFFTNLRRFGKHLGPVFLQVSDKFGPKRKEELFSYLETLPKELSIFLEVRHPDWFKEPMKDDFFDSLKKLKTGAVITDTAGRRDVAHMHITVPKTMIRFVGNDKDATDYERLDDWIARIKYWIESGLHEVYFFIHSIDEKFAPELAQYFIKELNEKCNAGLKEIIFLDQAQ